MNRKELTGRELTPFKVVLWNALYGEDFDDDVVYEDAVARIRETASKCGEVTSVIGFPGCMEVHISFKTGNKEAAVKELESLDLPTGDAIKANLWVD